MSPPQEGLNTSIDMVRDDATELREGYAEVGDVRLHYVEAGDGPLVVLLHGFPEFWYGWRLQIAPLAAAGFRVVAPDLRGYNLSSKPDGVAAYSAGKLAADVRGLIQERGAESALVVGHDWGGTAAWTLAMNHPEVVDRLAILNAAHPRKLNEGLRHPSQLRRSWYFFYFQLPDLPEHHVRANDWEFFQDFLRDAQPAYTPEEMERYIEAWSQPGAATAMINYYRFAVRHSSGEIRPITAPTLVIWGERDRYLGPDARRAPPRRRAQPRPRRAPARRLALGPPRRGRARQPAAHRLLRPRPRDVDHVTGGADVHDRSQPAADRIREFEVGFDEAELTDLRRRIAATRWPERETVDDDSQGVPLATMQELARYWATDYDWRRCEAQAERPAELPDRDRRAGHPLHPRPLAARGRAPADRHARLARLDHRAAEDHRAAHRSDGARRQRGGRLPPGDPLAAGPRVLRQADRHRLGSGAHRAGLGRC